MRYRERVWTPAPPEVLAVSVPEFKSHARIVFEDEDGLIESIYIPAAVGYVEKETQRLLTARACTLRLPCLPIGFGDVELPGGTVSSVASIVSDGATVDPGAYDVVGDSPARILALAAWPAVTGEGLPVAISYTAGFSVPPPELKVAVALIAAEMFRHRGESTAAMMHRIPLGAEHYMAKWRIRAL